MTAPPEMPPPPAAEPADAPPPAPAAAARGGRLRRFLFAPLCVLVGLAASAAVRLGGGDDPAHDPPERARPHELAPSPEPLSARVDLLIRAGSFGEALDLSPSPADPDDRAMAYRRALCLEGLGRWDEAGKEYEAAGADDNAAARARATLGRVRCALAGGDLAAARPLLDRVVLCSGHPDCRGRQVLNACLHLRAALEVLALGKPRAPDPLDPDALAWVPFETHPEGCLDRLPVEDFPPSPAKIDPGPGSVSVRRGLFDAGRKVTAHLPARPARELLEAVGRAAGLEVRVPADLSRRLGVPAAIDVEAAPLPEVLTALTGPAGAGWRIEGNVLVVEPAAAPTPAGARAAAERAVRQALDAAPDHPAAPAARVASGNLAYRAGRWRDAADQYREVLETELHSPEALPAAYNLGLAELRLGHRPAARARFLEAADRAPGTNWSDLGWWWVGRTHLDAAETAEARRAFRAALAGRTRAVTAAAALGACACELLDGDDAAARAALRGHGVATGDAGAALAELFDGLLRYRASPSPGRRDVVLTALAESRDGEALGPAGVFLAGAAYHDVGEPDRAVALYEAAAESTRGPLAARMTFAVAERFDQFDLRGDARQRYLAVTATDPGGLGPRAELRVAELAARDGRAAECVRRCRGLLDRPGVDRAEVLAVLGRGYELRGEYRRAAECFAGHVPAEE